MGRPTLTERYAKLEERRDELVKMGITRQPTAVHVQTVKVLKDLLLMGRQFSTQGIPAPLRAMMRTLDRMEPVLVEELASVPPDQIRLFLADLAARINTIVDVDGSGPAQSSSA